MSAAWWAIGGFGTGAGLMYLVDPRSGRRRRALAQDKARHALHEMENAAGVVSRDMAHRSRGLFFETLARVKSRHVDEPTLEARVRAALGRVCSHPHAIRVHVAQDRVRLDGAVLQAEHRRVISRLQHVRGVRKVEDQLEVHKQAGHHPDLQGGVERPGDKPELLQRNWAPSMRFLMGLGGLGMLGWGSSRRGILGTSATVFGAMLTLRGLTNLELKRLTGVGGGRQAIIIHKDITVHAPVEEVFAFWRAMENFPRFMRHIEEIRTHGEERSHWRVKGPAGIVFEWEATITRLIPNKVLAWKSIEGSTVQNSGIIHFEPVQEGRATRLDIRLSYNPPAGALGHAFARILGADPKREMDGDLQRFKSLLETGKATGHETVTREQVAPQGRPTPESIH